MNCTRNVQASLPCTFASHFFTFFSEALIRAASHGSPLLFAQKTSLQGAQAGAATDDSVEHGGDTSMRLPSPSLLSKLEAGPFLPHAPPE